MTPNALNTILTYLMMGALVTFCWTAAIYAIVVLVREIRRTK